MVVRGGDQKELVRGMEVDDQAEGCSQSYGDPGAGGRVSGTQERGIGGIAQSGRNGPVASNKNGSARGLRERVDREAGLPRARGGGRGSRGRRGRLSGRGRGRGVLLKFPVFIPKKSSGVSAASLYNRLRTAVDPNTYAVITNYRDIINPEPGILLASGSGTDQFRLWAELKEVIPTLFPREDDMIPVQWGLQQRRSLVVRGVPPEVTEEQLYTSNLALIKADSIQRPPRYIEGNKTAGSTIFLEAETDDAKASLMANGVKAGGLLFSDVSEKQKEVMVCFVCTAIGHTARACESELARSLGLDFSDSRPSQFYCYKCKTKGHRFRECKEDLEPTCGNCMSNVPGYFPHWPTDYRCPAREKLRNAQPKTYAQAVAPAVNFIHAKELSKVKVRAANLERRVDACEANNDVQAKAITQTRSVLRDVAMVSVKKKKDLSATSKRRLTGWHRLEMAMQQHDTGENKSGSGKKRGVKTSSLEGASRKEKKAARTDWCDVDGEAEDSSGSDEREESGDMKAEF